MTSPRPASAPRGRAWGGADLALEPGSLATAIVNLEAGCDYKAELERLMRSLSEAQANRLDLFLRESRGAWLACSHSGGGRALLIGNALTGTAIALARTGFAVTLLDRSRERLRYGRARGRSQGRLATHAVLADETRLPFHDQAFDLVVLEGEFSASVEEARRTCAGELVWIADNRLGYKLSTGHRGSFRVPGALEFLRRAVQGDGGRRTLAGYRSALRDPEFERASAFSVYPHSRDFSLVARCEGDPRRSAGPRLALGPKERANRLKMLGYGLGLFPVLTSSFALMTRRRNAPPTAMRVTRLLDALAEQVGEPAPSIEHVVATRGNSTVLLTAPAPTPSTDDESCGRWAIHIPLSPRQELRVRRNERRLHHIAEHYPRFPHAEPLFAGELDGLFLTCQRRLRGLTAPQISGEPQRVRRMLADVAERLTGVVAQPATALDEAGYAKYVGARFELVARYAYPLAVRRELERIQAEVREKLLGLRVPLVLYHADLRSKHVQVQPDGRVVGLLDWGSSEEADLPYFDLINLLIHERQHEQHLSGADAWSVVRDRREDGPLALRDYERSALDGYAQALDLPDDYCRAIEALFPVLVGGMAEKHWDFSRPRWLQRLYGLGL